MVSNEQPPARMMARGKGWGFRVAFCVWVLLLGNLQAGLTRTQVMELEAGWNAVWLEVSPANDQVAAVFDPAQVDMVARYFTPQSQVRFIDNPANQKWNTPAWGVWYAPSRAEAFLTSLYAIQGNSAYLVHATSRVTLRISGEVAHRPLRWNTDSYNLTGLPVSDSVRPTFARFFSGAEGRIGNQVYRLVDGSWQKVTNLAATEIRAGEAYWIFCEGRTTYQGPLEVRFGGGDAISFGASANLSAIDYINRGTSTAAVTVALESGDDLPLFRSIPDLANLNSRSERLTGSVSLDSLAAGAAGRFRLEVRPALMNSASGTAVLKFATGDGVVIRIPVRATKP